jgi:hypothetical protein
MVESVLYILSVIFGLVGGMAERYYSEEYEKDKELADQDSVAIGVRMRDLRKRMRQRQDSSE